MTFSIHNIAFGKGEDFTDGERVYLKFHMGRMGGFFTSLFHCMGHADHENLAKIEAGFPEEVQGFLAWTQGNLHDRVKAKIEKEGGKYP